MAEIERVPTTEQDHFNTAGDGGGDPRVSDVNNYTDVLSVNKYMFMDNAYYGTGGFRTGEYLIPHDREMFYNKRRNFSVYKNFVRPIVNSLVDPVFSEPAPRAIIDEGGGDTGSPIARAFIEDVDGGETNMQTFCRGVMHMARRHGVAFVLMDNFPQSEMPPTVGEAVDQRLYPYMVKKSGWEVVEVKTDDFGRLEEIAFAEEDYRDGNDVKKRARLWTREYSILMEKHKTHMNAAQGKAPEWEPIGDPVYHNLDVVPVIAVYSAERDSLHDTLPDPPLYDVARLNHLIYNKDSEIRDLERSQAFSILYLQSDAGGNVTLSNHNAIIVPPGSSVTPGYISPDAGQLNALVETNKFYMEDLFRSAEQSGVHAVQTTQSPSGVALAWRFWAVENSLKGTARLATVFEIQAMGLLSLYTGESYEYAVEYPTSYQPGDRMQEIQGLKTVVDMDPPPALKAAVYRKVAKIVMADEAEDLRDAVVDSITIGPPETPIETSEDGTAPDGRTTPQEEPEPTT
ncbi:MAG: hypothetical protein GF414_01535 [Candidatus Altiarchaeales archaeon]|nr:hypothetical protein [Candidatus Altiarchaeales archaeon]